MDDLINDLLAEYSETVEETTIKYLDGKEWHEYDFVVWLIKRHQQTHENAELIKSLLRDDRDRLRADRDRWKARCEAAEACLDLKHDDYGTDEFMRACLDAFRNWQKIKSEMEAE